MCGRMTLTRSAGEIAEAFALAAAIPDPVSGGAVGSELRPRYNVAPSQDVLTIEAGRVPVWRRWGLVPGWAKDPSIGGRLFNARSETVATKPSFRAAFRKRRCLVAADGFYEWTPRDRGHRPHHFTAADGGLLGFAGLFETWHGPGGEVVDSCTILTTEANEDLAPVHPRMPVILAPEDYDVWLASGSAPERLAALTVPASAGRLHRVEVGRHVNSPRHDDPLCLEPVGVDTPGPLFGAADGAR